MKSVVLDAIGPGFDFEVISPAFGSLPLTRRRIRHSVPSEHF